MADAAELHPVRCQVCGTTLFHAAALGAVEIVCPRHRQVKAPRHAEPQRFTLRDRPLLPPKRP